MKVLVTGATGFIGLNLLHALDEGATGDETVDPVAMVRPSTSTARLPEGTETVEGDLRDPDTLRAAMVESGADAVVHLAAAVYETSEMAGTNTAGTENLVDVAAAADIDRFVFVSTIGAHPDVPADEGSPYQRSKVESEALLFGREHPFAVSALYPTYIFGPRDYRLTRYDVVRIIAANRVLVPPLYTHDEYNVVHVADVVDSLVHCLTADRGDAAGRHLVTGPNLSNGQVLRTIARHAPGSSTVVGVPYALTRWGIKPAMDLLYRVGISPVPGEGFLERGDFGTVAPPLESRAPVEQRSWERALADTVAWYERVGLL
ncbi:NAD-dependent epimerase/dehydratase family protein [Halosimplex litoreum]|uniref:NAD-dependent epimerase/dehydratase family protein n=1 Tax=Halosimplex litoreum TaxID=1198301 RepID=A0A7T3FY31_9EURY|nr:NAD-dependent epimerase/dehydratase family protein [Halosimplex litoreum]QPV62838.1 NAD-dependent epimerase/dehydratase family protein [Halosimplex litoreum]